MEIATEMNIVFIFQLMPMNWISSSSGIEGLAFPKIWSLPQVEMFPFHSFVGRFTEMFPSAPAECNGMSSGSIKQPLTQIVSPVSPFCHFCRQFPGHILSSGLFETWLLGLWLTRMVMLHIWMAVKIITKLLWSFLSQKALFLYKKSSSLPLLTHNIGNFFTFKKWKNQFG